MVEFATLTLVQGKSEDEIHTALWEATRAGLVLHRDGSYAFLHDRVQEAAYALIPESERAAEHLRIGRVLMSRTPPDDIEEKIFEIVNQLDRGTAWISLPGERERVAELNLIAGKRAKTSTAYASALNYLNAGRALLAKDSWEQRYDLTFPLEYHRAECELLTADLAAAEERLTELSVRARNLADIAAVACLRLTLYTTLDRSDQGVEVCLEYQRREGVDWRPHPTHSEVRQEYERIWQQLGSRSIEELIDLPLMNSPESRASIDVLTEVVTPALFTDENLLALVICRMVNLSLEYGNSDGSCFAYVWLGMVLGPHFGDYGAGFRFGRLGYELVEKRGLRRYQARAYMSFGNLVMPWTRHVRTGRELVRRAFDAAAKIGDLTFAAYSCNNINTNLLASGDPLGDVEREAEKGLEFARKARFGLVIDIIVAQLGLIRTLRGLTSEFGCFNDERFDENRFEHHLQSDPRLALPECWYWIRKLQARVYANDCASALDAASKAQKLLWTSPSFFEMAEYHFYGALARAVQHDAASISERPQHLEALSVHHKQLQVWAENCPENFANRAALVAAEMARLEGRWPDAMQLYEQAIESAREGGFVQNEALAHEVAARFYLGRGFETVGYAYLRNARNCYERWGALGKMKQLDSLHPHLRQEHAPIFSAATIGTPVRELDVETVIKASQALSSEIVLSSLIEKLMRIVVEHAGAERGLLILLHGDEPRIEAQAATHHGRVDVAVRQMAVRSSDLPQSALHYVLRTGERVVLDDALVANLYSEDEYVRQRRPRSVLCLPIVKQTKLAGALYLENNLTPRAFTSDRVAVLELLASQAAISLENARLYSDLQHSEDRLRGVIDTIPAHVWSTTPDGAVDFINQRWMESTGLSLEDLLGQGWQSIVHRDDRASFLDQRRASLAAGEPMESEVRIRMADGNYRWLLIRIVPLRDELGAIVKWYGTGIEIEDRKRAEEQLRQAQVDLAHVNRVTTMGELTASMAHEVNQPIGAAVTDANTCMRWLARNQPDLEEARAAAMRVVKDATRASEIISRIRLLFNKGTPERELVDVNEIIGEMIVLLRSEAIRYNISVRTELAADLPQVMADRVQLQQVLMNLMINAIDAMKDVDGAHELAIQSQRAENEQLLVSVSDTGVGLPPKGDQIFNAFVTTKPHGTGMGLRISRSIVESHGGQLWAAANSPRGANFYFTLPLTQVPQ